MEVPHSIYQSVHRSRQEQNINNNTSRLPSFRHLLLTLGNVDKLDAPHVSFNVSPDLIPHLIEDCSNRSSSEDTTWDLHRLHSPKQVYKLTSPLALSKPAQCAVETAKQNTQGSDRPYRIVKDSRHRTSFPVPRGTTPKTQTLRPILKNAHQCRNSSHRAAGAGHISSSGAAAHGKSKALEKSHVAWQHNDSNMQSGLSDDCNRQIPRYTISPTPDRARSQDSLRNDSMMVCSASNMREHFYGNTSSPTITTVKDTSPVTLHHGSQQKARVNLFRPSHHVNLLLNEQQHDVNLTFEVNAPFDRDADPAMIAPRLMRHYLNIFFDHQKHTPFPIYDMLPRDEFIKWAVKCQTYRSLPDRLMLYALMSYATSLDRSRATGTSSLSHQAMFKAIVYREIETLKSQSPPTLQTVHMLLFLTLAEYGNHRYQAGADMFVVCVDVLTTVLKCNIEDRLNLKEPEGIKPTVYDFSAIMEAECRRCTFWTVFTFGTHMGLGTSSLQSINRVGGVTVELLKKKHHQSCEWLLQQPRSEPDTAMLGMSMTSREPPVNMPSDMTHDHMIEMTRICADVNTHISRSRPMRLSSRSCLDHEQRRQHLHAKLRTWADTYNDALVSRDCQGFHDLGGMSRAVGRSHIRAERTGGLHMLYYRCQMQLSRRVHHQHLSDIEVSSQARHATVHAIAILRLAEETMSPRGSSMRDYHFVTRSFSSACAVLEAIDVVTAVGRVADILEPRSRIMSLLYSGLDLLAHLGSPWGHEFVRYDAVKRRVQTVFRFAEAALGAQKPFFCCSDPMVETSNQLGQGFDINFDLTYGTDRNRYIRLAFPDGGGGSSKDDQDILIINTSSNNIGLS